MLRKKPTARVGLNIGAGSVKVVEIEDKSGKFKLVKFGIEPLKKKAEKDESVEAIKTLIKRVKPTTDQVNSSISGQSVIVRYIQFPKMTDKELAGAIKFEAEKYIPFNIDDVILDDQVLARTSDGRMKVLLVAAKADLIRDHIALIEEAGLKPALIDVDSFAVINSFQMSSPRTKGTVALLNIGSKLTSINILKEGILYFTRDIQIAGEDITSVVSEKLGIDAVAAEELKRNPGKREIELLEAIRPDLESFLGEIRLSFDYYESQFGEGISKIFLSGGSSKLKGLAGFLNEGFRVDVESWDPLKNLEVDPQLDRGKLSELATSLCVPIGLALRKG